ncbi:LysR family transcriptional regulator, partial [Acidihalobacter prosperus]
ERLGLKQSSVSHALDRLGNALGDQLFVKAGRGIVPIGRAQALAEPDRACSTICGVLAGAWVRSRTYRTGAHRGGERFPERVVAAGVSAASRGALEVILRGGDSAPDPSAD